MDTGLNGGEQARPAPREVPLALMPLVDFATFRGRARRAEFWPFLLIWQLLLVLANVVDQLSNTSVTASSSPFVRAFLMGAAGGHDRPIAAVLAITLACPLLAVTVRRLHDLGYSGWWAIVLHICGGTSAVARSPMFLAQTSLQTGQLLQLASVGIGIGFLVLMRRDGVRGPNRYGPDPKGRSDAALAEVFR